MFNIKLNFFYETGVIIKNKIDRISYFNEWLVFLQTLINNKIYSNLFDLFHFNKGICSHNDKLLHEPAFIRAIKSIHTVNKNNEPILLFQLLSIEFLIFLCDTVIERDRMISYENFKRKIISNLQNYDLKFN